MNQRQPSEDEILDLLLAGETQSNPDAGSPPSKPGSVSNLPKDAGADGGMNKPPNLATGADPAQQAAHEAAKAILDKFSRRIRLANSGESESKR